MLPINYNLLYDGDIFSTDIKELIALNRGLPSDWCKRTFTEYPSYAFAGFRKTKNKLLSHIESANKKHEKFQIVVDSDLDGIASAAIFYMFMRDNYPQIETTYSIHVGKQHGLSRDIKIDKDTTLVIIPDAGSNDVDQCHNLYKNEIDVICLDHHIIEQQNLYAAIVNCMDDVYPNQDLCGAAVTWLFLYGLIKSNDQCEGIDLIPLIDRLDLVATATIADVMNVKNEDNMFFISNGLKNITSPILKSFLIANEIKLDECTIEHIKYKVAPSISALIRMGSEEEKDLLFRSFIEDYKEFDYEKRGSFEVIKENIYDRVVRLCKNAKSRQDRAKQKLLEDCFIYDYPHIMLVEYKSEKSIAITGLIANELANQNCKPCIVYREDTKSRDGHGNSNNTGSIRNYDGSPIPSFKKLLEESLQANCKVQGHDNAAGITFLRTKSDVVAKLIKERLDENTLSIIGQKCFDVDFEINADQVDAGFIQQMAYFDNYTGHDFPAVTAYVHGIEVSLDNFKTMGKTSLNWKISENGVDYTKFKLPKDDVLIAKLDDISWDLESHNTNCYTIDAICTFGINVYNGEIHPQAIVKDYVITGTKTKTEIEEEDDFDLDVL